jgi:hypothetical protein
MEMLDRYLHAIEFWLPRAQKKDILAEISEDIHSQIEDEQAGLGPQPQRLRNGGVASNSADVPCWWPIVFARSSR